MRIGIMAKNLTIDKPAGPEVYLKNLIKGLSKVDSQNIYNIYLSDYPSAELIEEIMDGVDNFSYTVIESKLSWTHVGLLKELSQNPVQVLFTSEHTMPLIKKTKIVGMIHGLEYMFNKHSNPASKILQGMPERFVYAFADRIIVPSHAVKNDIFSQPMMFGNPEKIRVIYEGISKVYRPYSAQEASVTLNKYSLQSELYLVFVSTIQPRKNLPATIEAFSKLISQNSQLSNLKLAVIGKKGWNYEDSLNAPQKFGVADKVLFLGRLDDLEVAHIVSNSALFVNFSLKEGFGLPLAESMACGAVSAVSDIPAFKEVGDSIPFYADPLNVDSMELSMKTALQSTEKASRVEKGKKRALAFTWVNTAKETFLVMKSVVENF